MEAVTLTPPSGPARADVDQAIARGLAYLHQHQYPNGEFCSYCSADAPMQGWCLPDSAVFPTALIAGSLLFLAEAPQADEMLTRATGFFQYQMHRGGLWHHFTELHRWRHLCPLDVDDTACISDILRSRGIACPRPSNLPLLLANRTPQGLFYSWFLLRPRWNTNLSHWRITLPELLRPIKSLLFWHNVEAHRNDVDGVVNANALYYLGDRPETQPVIDFLLRIIAEGQETDCDLWYRDAHIVYYFFSRNYFRGISRLEPARQPVIARILAAARPDGRLGDTVVDTALAVCTLLNWRVEPPELGPAIDFLLRAQQPNGEWPRWLVYYGGPKKLMGWGSEEMTTAFCLEALARYRALPLAQ
jgi:hypothetical protein